MSRDLSATDFEALKDDALTRAESRLERFLKNRDGGNPTKRAQVLLTKTFVFTLVLTAVISWFAYGILGRSKGTSSFTTNVVILSLLGCLPLAFLLVKWVGARGTTPTRALQIFYKLLANGRFEEARDHVLGSDFDDFPRVFSADLYGSFQENWSSQGVLLKLDENETAGTFRFDEKDQFADYWKRILRSNERHAWAPSVKDVEIIALNDHLVVTNFRLELRSNTRRDQFLFFGLSMLSFFFRKTHEFRFEKLLIKAGDTWKLFDGDWRGLSEGLPDGPSAQEINASWLARYQEKKSTSSR